MFFNPNPTVIPVTQPFLYPHQTFPAAIFPQQRWLLLTSRTFTPTNYLSSLMKQSHIIAIQEHWLYNYEKKNMSEFCTEHDFSVVLKSVDDTDPCSQIVVPEGGVE